MGPESLYTVTVREPPALGSVHGQTGCTPTPDVTPESLLPAVWAPGPIYRTAMVLHRSHAWLNGRSTSSPSLPNRCGLEVLMLVSVALYVARTPGNRRAVR